MAHLFVLDLTYIAGLDAVDRHMEGHRQFLADHYAAGTFLASGRKVPRTGGVILAQGDLQHIISVIAEDPFAINEVARYTVTEFLPTMTGDALAEYAESHPSNLIAATRREVAKP